MLLEAMNLVMVWYSIALARDPVVNFLSLLPTLNHGCLGLRVRTADLLKPVVLTIPPQSHCADGSARDLEAQSRIRMACWLEIS